MNIGRVRSYCFGEILITFFCLWMLFPLLEMGLVGDDAYNSQLRGAGILYGFGLWEDLVNQIWGWWSGAGRLNVFSWFYTKFVFWHISSAPIIKALVICVVIGSVLTFGRVIRCLTRNDEYAYFCMLSLPMLFQFRQWHDPITNFLFLMPLVTLLMHLAILMLLRFSEDKSRKYFGWSVLFFTVAIFSYEISYLYVLIFLILFFVHGGLRRRRKLALVFLAIGLVQVVISRIGPLMFLPDELVVTYPGAAPSFVYPDTLGAYFFQTTGALPLTWKFSDAAPGFFPLREIFFACLILYFFLAYARFRGTTLSPEILNRKTCIYISGILVLIFPILPVLSGHGKEIFRLGFGYAYITVYAQLFGVAILLGLILHAVFQKLLINSNKILLAVVLVVMAFITTVTFNENKRIANGGAIEYKHAPAIIKQLHATGFFDELKPSDSVLIMNYRTPFNNGMFLSQVFGDPVNTCYVNGDENTFRYCLKVNREANRLPYAFTYTLRQSGELDAAVLCGVGYDALESGVMSSIYGDGKCRIRDTQQDRFSSNSKLNLQDLLLLPHIYNSVDVREILNSHTEGVFRLVGSLFPELGSQAKKLAWASDGLSLEITSAGSQIHGKEFCFTLVRPGVLGANIFVSFGRESRHLINFSGEEKFCFPILKSAVVNRLVIGIESGEQVNSDPRKIKFGILDWKLI